MVYRIIIIITLNEVCLYANHKDGLAIFTILLYIPCMKFENKAINSNAQSIKRYFLLIIIIIADLSVSILVGGCVKKPEYIFENWSYSNLRAMDPVDANSAYGDIIAAYNRIEADYIQIRLDFLDVGTEALVDIRLAIDYKPGGSEQIPDIITPITGGFKWDLMVNIPELKSPSIGYKNEHIFITPEIKVHRDTFMDAILIAIPMKLVEYSNNYTFLGIANVVEGGHVKTDSIGPVHSSSPPPKAITILFAFWDVFNSATPADALRSWDGAHTGPDSSRHGLRHLLNAAEANNTKLVLCIENKANFYTALEYLNISNYVEFLEGSRNIIIINNQSLCDNGYTHYTYITDPNTATNEGLSKNAISLLLSPTYQKSGDDFTIIGGPLQNSSWGSPDAIGPTLEYIASHPWIQLVDFHDRLTQLQNDRIYHRDYQFFASYNSIISNRLRALAWDTHSMLSQLLGTVPDGIRETYISQLGHILAAADWLNSPHEITDCTSDIDWDGEAECVLASENIFTTYELYGGYLAFAFVVNCDKPHQIIGPSCQLSVDSKHPELKYGGTPLFIDSHQILGALGDPPSHMSMYSYEITNDEIILASSDMAIRKYFRLTETSLTLEIKSLDGNATLQIPFILDPWTRHQPDWPSYYAVEWIDNQWHLSIANEFTIQIHSSEPLSMSSFLAPIEDMDFPEDPNYDYTPGYFLPFPMTLAEMSSLDMSLEAKLTFSCP